MPKVVQKYSKMAGKFSVEEFTKFAFGTSNWKRVAGAEAISKLVR